MINRRLWSLLPALALGCGAGATPGPTPVPQVDPEWAALLELSPPVLPSPPEDRSNRFADDARAAAFGHRLFFDPGFSGRLLESDNDGVHGGVGMQGEAGKVSCASCHVPDKGFVDTRTVHGQVSLASGWTTRRTPSVLDVGQARLLMWDGRFDSMQRQVLGVFESPMEGNSSRLFLAQEIARRHRAEYLAVFGADPVEVLGSTYPQLAPTQTGCVMPLNFATTPTPTCTGGVRHGMPGDGAEYDSLTPAQQRAVTSIAINVGKAIAAYERKLSCGTSRFDAYMRGDPSQLRPDERRGAALFVGRGQCSTCHSGPFFSDQKFHNVGLQPVPVAKVQLNDNDPGAAVGLHAALEDPLNVRSIYADQDDGRLPGDVPASMLGAFRTPMLRCRANNPSFMHTAQLRTLREVVEFFNQGGHVPAGASAKGFLGTNELKPLGLSPDEVDDLVAFLQALEGAGPDAALLRAP